MAAAPTTLVLPMLYPLDPLLNASVGLGGGVIAILSAIYFLYSVLAEEQGNGEMRRLRGLIYDGARAYLFTQVRAWRRPRGQARARTRARGAHNHSTARRTQNGG